MSGMWRMQEWTVCYARPFAQQCPGIGLECEEWKGVCVGSDGMLGMQVLSHSRIAMGLGWNVINGMFVWAMQLSFAHQTWSWNCLDLLQRFKSELGQSIMHDFTILSLQKHPSILHIPALFLDTVVQRVLHNTQSILAYVTFQTFCQSPNYCTQVAFGYSPPPPPPPDCAHFGGILTHFGIHNEWKMGG